MAEEIFVIPRDAESVSAGSVDDTNYVLVMRPGQNPAKVLVGDTGLKSKLTISDTEPLNANPKDRWINSELQEFVFLNGGWRPLGGYLAEAIHNAEVATENAIKATDSLLSNIISLEIRDDLCLWFETPETYAGVTFNVQNGNLTATI